MKKLIKLICTFLILFAAVSSSVGQDGLTDNYLVKWVTGGLRSSIIFEHPNSPFIGIGTDNPNFELTINGNLGLNNSIYIDDWGSMVIGRRDASVTHFDFQMQGPGSEYNPVLTLLGDKFVGIGNTDPTHSLHVIGDLLIELSIAGDSPVFYTGLDGFIGIGNKNPQSRLDVSGNILLNEILEFRGIENSIRCASGNLNFNVAGQSAIEIATTGNIGFGYSNPIHKLMVAGNTLTDGFIMETGAVQGRLLTCDSGGFASWIDQELIDDGDWITSPSGSNLYFLLGNIGIGTDEPAAKLHVEGTLYASEKIGIGIINPTAQLHVEGISYLNGNLGVGCLNPSAMFQVEGDSYLNGKLGIGCSNPSTMLQVDGDSYFNGNVGIGNPNPLAEFHVEGDFYLSGSLGIGNSTPSAMLHVEGTSFFGSNVGIGCSDPSAILHVEGDSFFNGNLGIGNSNPSAMLHVEGTSYFGSNVGIGCSNPSTMLQVEGDSFLNGKLGIGCINPLFKLHVEGDSYLNGKLGIGFLNSSAELHVNGKVIIGGDIDTPDGYKLFVEEGIISEKIKVMLVDDWSDYVFDEGYSLKEISEVEKYIKENKHLPDVPSAMEVAEEGIDLGQMDAILLKKIEELTLYIIQQQKQIETLNEIISKSNSN